MARRRLLGGRQYQEAAHPNPSAPGRAVPCGPWLVLRTTLRGCHTHKIGGPRLASRLSDLTDELERNGVGKTVRLTVQRDGRTRTVETDAPHLVSGPRTTKFPSRALQDRQKCRSYKDMTGMRSKPPGGLVVSQDLSRYVPED